MRKHHVLFLLLALLIWLPFAALCALPVLVGHRILVGAAFRALNFYLPAAIFAGFFFGLDHRNAFRAAAFAQSALITIALWLLLRWWIRRAAA